MKTVTVPVAVVSKLACNRGNGDALAGLLQETWKAWKSGRDLPAFAFFFSFFTELRQPYSVENPVVSDYFLEKQEIWSGKGFQISCNRFVNLERSEMLAEVLEHNQTYVSALW